MESSLRVSPQPPCLPTTLPPLPSYRPASLQVSLSLYFYINLHTSQPPHIPPPSLAVLSCVHATANKNLIHITFQLTFPTSDPCSPFFTLTLNKWLVGNKADLPLLFSQPGAHRRVCVCVCVSEHCTAAVALLEARELLLLFWINIIPRLRLHFI